MVTLGCRTNQYESQAYVDQLSALGYEPASEGEVADVCIVNTCTVTESADSSSRHQIRLLTKENPGARILITGCLAERIPEEIIKMEGVSDVVSNKEKEKLLERVFPGEDLPEFAIRHFDAHTRAFVKVQDGCNSFCTYCIIPYVRGRSRSRRVEDVVAEVKQLVANGYKEVVLTGINVGDFDGAPHPEESSKSLADLVRAVDQVEGLQRLRISSIDPDEVNDDLLDAVIHGKNTCPSMHIVLQSGSNVILKRMNRKYTKQIFCETVDRLKKADNDFTFTTDVIVGFPGESDADFQDTLQVMEKVRFAKVHMFPYSERARTRAALFSGKVSTATISERKRMVLEQAEIFSFSLRAEYVGRTMPVLVESEDKKEKNLFSGHTANFLPVLIRSDAVKSNDLVQVQIIDNSAEALIGRVVL